MAGKISNLVCNYSDAVERSVIAKAIGEYHLRTCIKFRPRTTETDYIHLTKGNGCSSHVGRTGGAQPVTLGPGCVFTGIAIHELMHAVGFWHEQSRWDRDDHVNVYFQNVRKSFHSQDFTCIQRNAVDYLIHIYCALHRFKRGWNSTSGNTVGVIFKI
jgi:hypothetical protein